LLEFHVFDLAISNVIYKERLQQLIAVLANSVGPIKFVRTLNVENYEGVKRLHDSFVDFGYEGAIIRNYDGMYEFGHRSTQIFKMKDFKDEEFKILGYNLGKRGAEDMCFIMEAGEGKQFEAKPMGNREQKEWYVDNFDSIEGLQATVRFLEYSLDGIPQGNPVFIAVRNYE
jgi:ATP-dependent DNA ligase